MRIKAQTLLEYIILVGLVTMVLFAVSQIFKRGIQGIIKVTSDEIGNQQDAEQKITKESGYLVDSYTLTRSDTHKNRAEQDGNFQFTYNDTVNTISNSLVNLGFSNRTGN